ncbi:site-specific DNA-methyltransferase [Lactococcus lactis]|uniref:site-specific DNA-methyltransferase n=1 Tax=Lactococcus lactis TaxID=1358 RepID=UPI0035656FC2
MTENIFNERPHKNEKLESIDYVKNLIEKARDESCESDIPKLEKLIRLLNFKKYGLVWEEHAEEVEEKMKTKIPVFTEDVSKKIMSNPDSEDYNFLLEGDNLHSLHLLEKTHLGKIDVIYIDPPYNTTNEGFTYNDKKVDSNDAYRHSKWLSFMEKRLKIASSLLSKNGILFISIDDKEYQNIKSLTDEIFGENCFVTSFIWQKKTGASDAKGIATITEYILCYCNNKDKSKWNNIFSQNFGSFDKNRYRHTDEYYNLRGPFYYDNLDRGGLTYSDSMNFGVEAPDGKMIYPNGRQKFEKDGWIWKWGKNKIEWGFKNGFLEFQKSKNKANGWALKYKNYLNVDNEGKPIERSAPYKNLIQFVINQAGTNELKSMFNNKSPFSNPKPSELIKYLISLSNKKDAKVFDFFAGSGTTGQAVLKLNQEDGGKRTFILATNNENNIAEEITYTRLSKIINGYKASSKTKNLLYEYKFTISKLKNANNVLEYMENVIAENRGKYDSISKSMKDNVLQVFGEYNKDSEVYGIPANLKYFKTDFVVKKEFPDVSLEYELLKYITPLVELEFGIDITNPKVQIVLNEEQLELLIDNKQLISKSTIFMHPDVFRDDKQNQILQELQIRVQEIPNYFFGTELWAK